MHQPDVVYLYIGLLIGNKKEQITNTDHNWMDIRLTTEDHILHDSIYKRCPE